MKNFTAKKTAMALLTGFLAAGLAQAQSPEDLAEAAALADVDDEGVLRFDMVPTSEGCLSGASGRATVFNVGGTEVMRVTVRGLPPDTEFDLFLTQVPGFPFGLSWYQGDIETNSRGVGTGVFRGRFNIETFIVAVGQPVAAPFVHDDIEGFPDAFENPVTAPVHTFHLGLWFDSPDDAVAAGCPGAVTPFNGEHNAGVQVLNTSQFPDLAGPLVLLGP